MNKTLIIIVAIVAILITLFFTIDYRSNRIIDWEESYNEKSNKPYGLSVLYKELPTLFKDKKIRTVYYTPYTYLYANSEGGYGDHVAEGNYILIGNSDYLGVDDIDELLYFAESGNTVFISDSNLPTYLKDTLNVAIDYFDIKDSISKLSFTYHSLKSKSTKIDKVGNEFFFSSYEGDGYQSLGYVNNNIEQSNFLEIQFGDGFIYLHLQPKAFSNYHLLKEERYTYAEGVLAYLPNENVYYDSFTKYYDSYYGNAEEKSNLSWFLQQTSFKWAWYLALILTLLFMIFNAKRRQRIINIIKPLNNTTVEFVKTISNLYFETQDHKNLIDKKITYFLEKIRTDYYLDTSTLDEEFITKLASKSGKKKESVKKIIDYISWLQTKEEVAEINLLSINKLIEDFYSK